MQTMSDNPKRVFDFNSMQDKEQNNETIIDVDHNWCDSDFHNNLEHDDKSSNSTSYNRSNDDSDDNIYYLEQRNYNIDIYTGLTDDDDLYKHDPYFTSPSVPDSDVPLCLNTFTSVSDFTPPSVFLVQMKLQDLFHCNNGSLKMYDETIEIFNQYIVASDFNKYARLMPRNFTQQI